MEYILEREKPASIECCAFLNKPSKRTHEVNVKYIGIEIEDHFVIGYGLDYNERYRDLTYIGVYSENNSSDSSGSDEPDDEPEEGPVNNSPQFSAEINSGLSDYINSNI